MHYFEEDEVRFSSQAKPDANAFFPTMPSSVVDKLREKYHFYDINSENGFSTIRLMTSFSTSDSEIDGFIELLNEVKDA